jgi:hypothetical protein
MFMHTNICAVRESNPRPDVSPVLIMFEIARAGLAREKLVKR